MHTHHGNYYIGGGKKNSLKPLTINLYYILRRKKNKREKKLYDGKGN